MATTITTSAPVHRLTVDDVIAMVRAGILDEHARVELVDGVLVDMIPIGPEHGGALTWLNMHLAVAVAGRWVVRVQDVIVTADGYRLPDLLVLEPIPRSQLPRTALLAVEVAQTSQRRDREKIADYAALGVAEYWIVDLDAEVVTVHRDPQGDRYVSVAEHRDGAITTLLDGVPAVVLAELFGTA